MYRICTWFQIEKYSQSNKSDSQIYLNISSIFLEQSRSKDLTTNFLRSRDMVEFNIERPGKWKVRGQIVDKIDFDPKTLIILSDKFVNQLCLIVNAFQFEIMYICGK